MHIVVASIEKIVPTLEDASHHPAGAGALGHGPGDLHLYDASRPARAATEIPDGPAAYHVVLLDNGRSEMLGSEFQAMLRCIRCGACLNHCPVYARDRRPRLWLALSRAHGRGADAGAARHRAPPAIFPTLRPSAAAARRSAPWAFRCRR